MLSNIGLTDHGHPVTLAGSNLKWKVMSAWGNQAWIQLEFGPYNNEPEYSEYSKVDHDQVVLLHQLSHRKTWQ